MDKNSSLMQSENNSYSQSQNGERVKYARPHYSLGKALAKKGEWEEAIASYQKAIELAPHWEEVRQSLAVAENQLQEKRVNGQQKKEAEGKSSLPHYRLGKLLASRGEWDEAIACYSKSIEVEPNFADVYHCLGDALVETGEKEEAIKVYQKAIEIEPNLWEVHHKLGNLLQEVGQLDEAVGSYRKSIELKSDFCWSFNNLGDVLVKLEKWEEAAGAYRYAVELNPDFPWGHYKLGDVLVELEDWEEAIAAFRHAIELAPDLPRVNEKLGDALRHQIQRYSEEASRVYHQAIQENQTDLQVYYKALEVNSKDVQTSLRLADTLKSQGQLEQAVTFYKSTLQLEPNNAEVSGVAWQQLGELLLELEHFEDAIAAYRQAVEIDPKLAEFYRNWGATKRGVLNFNVANQADLEKQEKKDPKSSLTGDRPRVAVCSWELAHNSAGRVYSLAKIYETFADVEIIGSIFPTYGREIWNPIRKTSIPCHTFIVEDESRFLEQAINLVLAHPYDMVHLSKPRLPNILFGLLYKLVWDARIIMDIDDEELAFVEAETPIQLEDYLKSNSQLPALNNLAGKEWTQIAVGLAQEFDGVTVSNPFLQKLYGGEIVRHARDENLFQPSPERKRQSREKFGIAQDKKVVLFLGTPREHKGLLEIADAIAALQRKDLLFAIVGDFPDPALKARLQAILGVEYVFLGNQAFDDIPDVAAVGDVCILLQDAGSRVSQFQIPAKLSDALGMGLKVLIQELPPVADIVQSGAVIPVTNKDLGLALERVLSDVTLGQKLGSQARKLFASEFTLTNNAPKLQLALESVMAKPASKGKLSQKLSLFLNYLFPVHSINKTAKLTGKGLLPPETLVSISNAFFRLDAFAEATVCLLRALTIRPDGTDALLEYKNQYCYHAYSSWLMETVEGISDWHKADGLPTRPDWGMAAKLCKRFLEDDSSKNSPDDIKQYVQVELLLAEEYRENGERDRAKKVLREALQTFGKGLPSSLRDSIVTSVDTIGAALANTCQELLQNIQSQVDTIPPDALSVTDWLYLNDVLNWNGLFKCGLAARNKGIQQAYNLGETEPNNKASLKMALLAAIDRADFQRSQRYIDKLLATNLDRLELSEIIAYQHLQEGDIEGFRKLWPRKLTSVDMRFQQYIQGKSVAIVGPAPTGIANGAEIDSFDVVIRFNYRGQDSMPDAREYGTKTHISLYNAHSIRYLIYQNQLAFLSELDFCLLRRPRHDLESLGWDRDKIRQIHDRKNIFYKSLNAAPAALFDILLQGAGTIKLFKSNFYLASQQHSEKYRNRDEKDFSAFALRKIQPVLANHDLISQLNFTRNLWKTGAIGVDDRCAAVLELSDEDYLSSMEKLVITTDEAYERSPNYAGLQNSIDKSLEKPGKLDFENYCNLGQSYESANKKSEALWAYYKAFQINPQLLKEYQAKPSNTDLFNSYVKALQLDQKYSDLHLELGRILEEKGDLAEAVNCYQYFLKSQVSEKDQEIAKCVGSYNTTISKVVNAHRDRHEDVPTKPRYKRLIFVVMSVPHKILTILSLLRFQKLQKEYEDCDDYLVLAGGNPQGINILLQIAEIWQFKKAIDISNVYNFLRSQKSAKMLNITVAQELIRKQIGLESVDVVYHWSPTDDIIWSLYPQSRKICFGDALGILKKHSITRRFNPSDSLVVDEAYLLAPYEETEGMFAECPTALIAPQCYRSVINDSANAVKGLREYCNQIKQEASSSIVFLPTSYLAQSPEVKDFNKEIEIYLSYALKYTSEQDTIVIKAHPTLKAQKQSRVLVQKLKENRRECIEIDDNFDDVPLELFAILINPKRVLSVLSTCSISIGYLCGCEIVMGLDENIIAKFKKDTTNNASWDIKQKVIYLQAKQAYKKSFSPLTHIDVSSNSKFPKFPVLIQGEDIGSQEKVNSKKSNIKQHTTLRYLQHSAWLHHNFGQYYASLNNYKAAISELHKATQLEPNNSWFYYSLGKVFAKSGKKRDAIQAYHRATELNFYSPIRDSILERKGTSESNLRGLVVINSMEKPSLGMNKSIQIVTPYLALEHGIHLEYSLSQLDIFSETIAHKLHWYDFVIFNSAASLSSWNHSNFKNLISKLNIPIFIYWHETDWSLNNWKQHFPIAYQTIREISSEPNFAHLTVSEACSRAIKKNYPKSKNIHKIYECTDIPTNYTPRSKQVSEFPPFVLNIASIQERKGTDLFVETAIKVCQKHPTVQFICLGKVTSAGQELYKNCTSKIKSLGLEDRILFPGHVEFPWEFYLQNASVFFLSSRDDPFPLSILEAMCTGRNIVAFNVGGSPEALDKYGTIIEPFDTDAAAKAIIDLLRTSSDNLVNENAIERYQSLYTPERLADRIANCVNLYLKRGLKNMDKMDKEELLRKRDELAPWIAPIYLGQGVWTRSAKTVNPAKLNWYMDTMELALGGLKGKRVLDIGSNTGYVACEAALRGAEVVSIEPHPENYLRCKLVYEARGVLNKNLTLTKDDMEKIDIKTFGKFDGIFFCGTIYHCQEPWVVLARYYEMTDVLLVESRLCPDDDFNKEVGEYQFKAIYEKSGSPLHAVSSGTVLHPTRRTLFYMLRDTGFTNIHQLMPYPEMTPKYLAEECVAFLCNKLGKKPLKILDEFDKQS